MMKFNKIILFSAIVPALFSSCLKTDEIIAEEVVYTIKAEMVDDLTKTSVTDAGYLTWSSGDEIWLHTTAGGVTGTLSSGAGTPNATFTYGPYFGEMTGKAVYPYNENHSITGEDLSVYLPSVYNLGSNTENPNALMYAYSADGILRFSHMAGVMKFPLKNVPAGATQLKLTLDKKINGNFVVNLSNNQPVLATTVAAADSEKTITLNFDPIDETSDINLYFPLPVGVYNSLALELNSETETLWSYSKAVTNNVNRKALVLMPNVFIRGEYEDIECLDLSAEGTANSYIVSSAGHYSISAVKGNSSESVGAVASADVLWESFGTSETPAVGSLISSVSYDNGRINFSTARDFRCGNAVIAAKDAFDQILWSWHIWMTPQPAEQVYYNTAGIMMDRNLGASSATAGEVEALGLYYQWGRKDPFLGASSINANIRAKSSRNVLSAVQSSSETGTIEYTVANPTTFVTANSENVDWQYEQDDTRWGLDKTIYDPCPVGWRVPKGGTKSVWKRAIGTSYAPSYNNTNYGFNANGKFGASNPIWYPGTGYMNAETGNITDVGYTGFSWASTCTDIFADCFYFTNTGAFQTNTYDTRAAGFPVRCVKGDTTPPSSYTIRLSPNTTSSTTYGWSLSTSISNPDPTLYDGVYQSNNKGVASSAALMYIDIVGYENFSIYVRSYAESSYDYVVVSNLDCTLNSSITSGTNVKMTTSDRQTSNTSINGYTLVEFTNIGGGEHTITIMYKKDVSVDSGDDRGYVLIP